VKAGAPIRRQGPAIGGTIKERSRPDRRASTFGRLDVPEVEIPAAFARVARAELPEVSEIELVRHYTRLS